MSTRLRVGQRGRSDLLGTPTPPGSSGRSTPFYEHTDGDIYGSQQRTAEEIESQNDERLVGLNAKVRLLKDVTIAIGNEVKDSAQQLSQMNDAFAETSGILSGTFNRLKRMSSRQGCRYIWFILFFIVVFWFFLVMWWMRR